MLEKWVNRIQYTVLNLADFFVKLQDIVYVSNQRMATALNSSFISGRSSEPQKKRKKNVSQTPQKAINNDSISSNSGSSQGRTLNSGI